MPVHRFLSRRLIATAAAAALVAGVGAIALVRSGGDHADADAARWAAITEQPDERSASFVAAKAKRRIEVSGLTSPTGQVFAEPDGSFVATQTIEPVRARRADGSWGPIDTTLQPQADGTFRTAATPAAVTVSGGGTGPLMVLRDDAGHELSMTWPAPLPKPAVAGAVATFAEVLPGVDLQVRGDRTGARKVLVVKTPEAARSQALREIAFDLHTAGVTVAETGAETLSATDANGKVVFATPTSSVWDARTAVSETGALQTGEWGPSDAAKLGTVGVRLDGDRLLMSPDPAVLLAGDAQFPIRIDPVWGWTGQNAWQLVSTQDKNKSYWNGGDRENDPEGKVSVGRTRNGSVESDFRAFMRFDTSFFRGKDVREAHFYTVMSYAWSWACNESNYKLGIYRYSGMNTGLTWNNHEGGWGSSIAERSETWGNKNGNCAGDLSVDTTVTSYAQDASNLGWGDMQFGLRSMNESCDSQGECKSWRRFKEAGSAPDGGTVMRLSVRYNTPPGVADGIQVDGRACDNTTLTAGAGASYTVSAVLHDPDNENVTGVLHVFNSDGTVLRTLDSGTVGNGTRVSWQISTAWLVSNRTYSLIVMTSDTIANSWSPTCKLSVDLLPPAIADVDSVDYPDDGAPHGSVGRTGDFLLKVPADAAKVLYGPSDPPTTELALSGANPTVQLTPTAQGVNFVHVKTVDAAGNQSTTYHYQYVAGAPSDPIGHWKLDDGSGTTAVDTPYPGNPDDVNKPLTITGSGGMQWVADHAEDKLEHGTYLRSNGGYQRVSTSGPVVDTTRSYTVSAWARLTGSTLPTTNEPVVTAAGTRVSAFNLSYGPTTQSWGFTVSTADNETTNTSWVRAASATPARLGVWTHLAGVYDAGSKKAMMYVNGVKVAEKPVTSVWKAGGPLDIGSVLWTGSSGTPFHGDIDDVRAYNRVVAPEEFVGLTRRAEAWWSFDDGLSTTADRTGNGRSATLVDGTAVSPGFTGHGVSLNGTNSQVTTAGPAVRTDGSFTVSAWVRLLRGENWQTVVSQDGTRISGFFLKYNGGQKRWEFHLPGQDADNPAWATGVLSTEPARIGEWTHLAGVYDAERQQVQLWVDGALQGTATAAPQWNATGPLVIGRGKTSGTAVDFLYGDIDEVMAHTGALNAQQIAVLADRARRLPATHQLSADFTGDGKADSLVIQAYPDQQMKLWQLTSSTGQPLETPVEVWDSQFAPWDMPSGWQHDGARWNAADFNGDGMADISLTLRNDAMNPGAWVRNTQVWLFYSTGSGFDAPQLTWESTDGSWPLDHLKVDAGDVTGDGKGDLVIMRDDAASGFHVFTFAGDTFGLQAPVEWYGLGTQFANSDAKRITNRVADFNGDGKADLVQFYQQDNNRTMIYVNPSDGARFTGRTMYWDSGANGLSMALAKPVVADVTGDGKADVVVYYNAGTSRQLWQWTSTGTGLAAPSVWTDTATCTGCATAMNSWADLSFVAGNFDGDADKDLLGIRTTPGSQQFTLWGFMSTGTGFAAPTTRYVSGPNGL
ncbi:LamG-like jellyroll fold domain-containing protein [Dactylosporangium sp. CS-033363]|uniref:LamG-like jellyroll fold domain-containing protein n=1 Tax=Dactylosporangium sp. CS-033363 TaxID=3239935 RepID=UPI003D93F387